MGRLTEMLGSINAEISAALPGDAAALPTPGVDTPLKVELVERQSPVQMLQDLVVSAVNEALRQANDAMENSMNGVTGGLDLSSFGL